jgi:NADPH2:quinone reductase
VGHAAVQIARALGAGKIIGTAGSANKLDAIRQCGADVAVSYRTEDFVEIVKRETNGHGADVIYDPVGGEVGERSTKCIAFEGRLVIIGFTSGAFPALRANHILIKNYSVVGLHWGYYRQMKPAAIEQGWRELLALVPTGRLRPIIGGRYPMHEAAKAMQHLASRDAIGKIVLYW